MEDANGSRRPHEAKSIARNDPAVAANMSTGRAVSATSDVETPAVQPDEIVLRLISYNDRMPFP